MGIIISIKQNQVYTRAETMVETNKQRQNQDNNNYNDTDNVQNNSLRMNTF